MTALLTLTAGVLGYFLGKADGALYEKRRITKLLAGLSAEADREHNVSGRFGWTI